MSCACLDIVYHDVSVCVCVCVCVGVCVCGGVGVGVCGYVCGCMWVFALFLGNISESFRQTTTHTFNSSGTKSIGVLIQHN